MSNLGIQTSDLNREAAVALYDHMLGLLKEHASPVRVIYGSKESFVEPVYTASFPKDFNDFPVVSMSITSNRQEELGVGRVAAGPNSIEFRGVTNHSQIQFDIWARNMLELESVYNEVVNTLQERKGELYDKGIRDVKLFDVYTRAYDPNRSAVWYRFTQAPGELWGKLVEYNVIWDYIWTPTEEVYNIRKIDAYPIIEDGVVEIREQIGLIILNLIDSMYLSRQLGRGIKTIRTGGRY